MEAHQLEHGARAHRTGILVNLSLAVSKVVVGTLTGSQALLADGWHSLSDGVTGAVAWIGFNVGNRPPDEDHHYGHGNLEALAAAIVGLTLLGGGLGIVWSGIDYGHSVKSGSDAVIAVLAACVSIVANLYLTRLTLRTGRMLESPSLLALAKDNGADVLSSGLVVLAVVASRVGVGWAEPAVTVLIGFLVCAMGSRSVWDGVQMLTGRIREPDLRGSLAAVAEELPGVLGVQRVRIQPTGSRFQVDMEISVDGARTVLEGHTTAHAVERAVRVAEPRVVEVHVHVNPQEPVGAEPDSDAVGRAEGHAGEAEGTPEGVPDGRRA